MIIEVSVHFFMFIAQKTLLLELIADTCFDIGSMPAKTEVNIINLSPQILRTKNQYFEQTTVSKQKIRLISTQALALT